MFSRDHAKLSTACASCSYVMSRQPSSTLLLDRGTRAQIRSGSAFAASSIWSGTASCGLEIDIVLQCPVRWLVLA